MSPPNGSVPGGSAGVAVGPDGVAVAAAVGDLVGVAVFFEPGDPSGVGVLVDVGVRVGVPVDGSAVEPGIDVDVGDDSGVGVSVAGVDVAVGVLASGVGVLVGGGRVSTREAESTYAVMAPPGARANVTRNSTKSVPAGATAPEIDRGTNAPEGPSATAGGGAGGPAGRNLTLRLAVATLAPPRTKTEAE
jgi:hypothetical protein